MVDVKCKSVTLQTQAGGGLEPGYSPGCHYPHDPGTSQLGPVDIYTVDMVYVGRYIYTADICIYLLFYSVTKYLDSLGI